MDRRSRTIQAKPTSATSSSTDHQCGAAEAATAFRTATKQRTKVDRAPVGRSPLRVPNRLDALVHSATSPRRSSCASSISLWSSGEPGGRARRQATSPRLPASGWRLKAKPSSAPEMGREYNHIEAAGRPHALRRAQRRWWSDRSHRRRTHGHTEDPAVPLKDSPEDAPELVDA